MDSVKRLTRKKLFWAAVLVAVYMVFGFFILPGIVHRQLVKGIAENLGRQATVEKVKFNPLIFSLTIRGFELPDPDGSTFVAFDEFYADFQVSSLVRWAFTFKELRLDNPNVHVRIMPDKRPNFADILDRLEAASAEKTPEVQPDEEPSIPRVIVGLLQINGARFDATNLAAPEPEAIAFTPADFELLDFSTIPNRDGRYTLGATGQGGGRWEWTGSLTFEPMRSSGSFTLQDEGLRELWDVAKNRVNFEIMDGEFGMRFDYAVEARADSLIASVTDASISVDRFVLREKGREPDLFSLDSLRVTGIDLRYPQQKAAVKRVALSGADIVTWLTEEGEINWLSVFPAMPPDSTDGKSLSTQAGADSGAAPLWQAEMGEFALEDFAIHIEDRTTEPDFAVDIAPINATLQNISSESGALFDVLVDLTIAEEGRLRVEGRAGAQPPEADVDLRLSGLPLPMFQPYLTPLANLRLTSGDFDVAGRVRFREGDVPDKPDIQFSGQVASHDFETKDTMENARFLAWKAIEVNGIDYDSKSVTVTEIVATSPYAKVVVHEDRTTNIQDIMTPPGAVRDTTAGGEAADTTEAAKPAAAPFPTKIGVVRVVDGSSEFADYSLILPFAAGIESLDGEITGLSSESLARADVALNGVVHPNGIAEVKGQINPLSGDLYTNVDVIFRDFDLPVLTPYSGQFIGREIEKGKLKLDLNYQVEGRYLVGDNKIVLDQFELGDDVESPDATSLPVGLAIALLKNKDGVIDLDVPVEGDLDNPKFSVWDAIRDVIVNTVTKAVTAPFKLLGSLVGFGGDGDELSYVGYAAGSSELSDAEKEKVVKLGEALNERPQLKLDVRGGADPEADGVAIRESKFKALVADRIAADPKKYAPPPGVETSPRLLKDLYIERFGKDAAKALEQKFQIPELDKEGKPKKNKTVLDDKAYYEDIRRTLVDLESVDELELQTLAVTRGRSVKELLVSGAGIVETRIFLVDVNTESGAREGVIRTELTLSD